MGLETTQNITLDLTVPRIKNVRCVQDDRNSRIINIVVTNDGKPYKITNTMIVSYKVCKPDSNYVWNKKDVVINDDGSVTIDLSEQAVAFVGIAKSSLKIQENEQKISTLPFNIIVEKAVVSDDAISSSIESDIIDDMENHLVDYNNPHRMPDATTEIKGITQLTDSVTSDSITTAATPNSVKTVNDALKEEVERATDAEKVLTDNLDSEIGRAKLAESALTTNLDNEIERAKEAEKTITDNLNAEITRAKVAEKTNTDAISSEVIRATAKENEIATNLSDETTRATNAESTLTSNLNSEISRAKSAESTNATNLTNHNVSSTAHSDIRSLITTLTTRLNTLADSDDTTLDQLSEVVAYIKSNRTLIENVTTNKVNVADIIDNLTSTATNKPLSAKQGKVLNDLISSLTSVVSTKIDTINGDTHIDTSKSGTTGTITHKDVKRTNTTSTASPSHGGTFTAVKTVTSDAKGHVTGVDTETVTLPTYGVATASALGLVKSGTDITVDSSGNVSVNDDSHNHVISNVDGLQSALNGKANSSHTHGNEDIISLDASKIVSGIISIDRLPQGALERLIVVADDTARFKLTSSNVQKGDTVKVTSTGKMYYVVDETKLSSEAGYEVYAAGTAASVPWSGVTGKPNTYTPSEHTHTKSQIVDFPISMPANGGNSATAAKLATARKIGNASFDGSADITLSNIGALPQIIGYYGSDNANTAGWYKVCTVSQSGYSDYSLNLLITQGYGRLATGILHVHTRCENDTTIILQSLKWMYRYGFAAGDIIVTTGNNTWSLYVYQPITRYGRIQVEVISKSGSTGDTTFTLLSYNATKETSTPSGTAATDGGIVQLANTATTATKLATARTIALTGSVTGSGTFDGSGNLNIATTTNHAHASLKGWADTRKVATKPNDYNNKLSVVGIKEPSLVNSNTTDFGNYVTIMGIRGWGDSSGGDAHEIGFAGNGTLWHRHGGTTSFGSWGKIYTSQDKPTLSELGAAALNHTHNYAGSSSAGGAATNADKLDGYHGSSSQAANTYVLRDGNGYTYHNYINSNTSNSENPPVSQFIVTNGTDHYYRKASLAHVKSALGSMTPSSHASSATTYGVGDTSNYGHVKISTSSSVTSNSGLVLSASEKNPNVSGSLANQIANISGGSNASVFIPILTGMFTLDTGDPTVTLQLPTSAIHSFGRLFDGDDVTVDASPCSWIESGSYVVVRIIGEQNANEQFIEHAVLSYTPSGCGYHQQRRVIYPLLDGVKSSNSFILTYSATNQTLEVRSSNGDFNFYRIEVMV